MSEVALLPTVLALVVIAVAVGYKVLQVVAPHTAWTWDDRVVAAGRKAESISLLWSIANAAWQVAEATRGPSGQESTATQRLAGYLLEARSRYTRITGLAVTRQVEEFLVMAASALCSADKVERNRAEGAGGVTPAAAVKAVAATLPAMAASAVAAAAIRAATEPAPTSTPMGEWRDRETTGATRSIPLPDPRSARAADE